MRCGYFEAGRCGSCTLLPEPYRDQVSAKQVRVAAALAPWPGLAWAEPVTSAESGFRNKAKLVVAGTAAEPTLGILDERGGGVDLRECPLYSPALHALLPPLAALIGRAAVEPYDVRERRGELKHLLVTESPDGEFLVRFVLRSAEAIDRLRKHLPALLADHPQVVAVSVNLQPRPAAVLEGPQEVPLTEQQSLPMRLPGVRLHLPPRSFFQTNTAVAAALYAQAQAWADRVAPTSVLDLYCGVGGFALHLAGPDRTVHGVEVSQDAVAAARRAADEAGLDARFVAADATADPGADPADPTEELAADLIVVNPPRRGLGAALAARLDAAPARAVLYSSCQVDSLARDLAAMGSWRPVQARLFDMFPHTPHHEVAVLLVR